MDISLDPHSKKVNLLVNGPLSSVKITRHSSSGSSHLRRRSSQTPSTSQTFAAGQLDWWIEKNHSNNPLEKETSGFSLRNSLENGQNVELEAEKVSEQLSKDLALKRHKYEVSREKLKDRLKESAMKKAEAFQKVLLQYHKESIDNHAPYLNSNGQTPRARQKLESERMATIIPKALSLEDLDIAQLPQERPYMVLGKEKYTFQQRYFDVDSPRQESSQSLQDRSNKELEKELRTSYRVGHLDEIKKKQFGKVYSETRQYYMDLERFQFLQEQTIRNNANKKTSKSGKAVATPSSNNPKAIRSSVKSTGQTLQKMRLL